MKEFIKIERIRYDVPKEDQEYMGIIYLNKNVIKYISEYNDNGVITIRLYNDDIGVYYTTTNVFRGPGRI